MGTPNVLIIGRNAELKKDLFVKNELCYMFILESEIRYTCCICAYIGAFVPIRSTLGLSCNSEIVCDDSFWSILQSL